MYGWREWLRRVGPPGGRTRCDAAHRKFAKRRGRRHSGTLTLSANCNIDPPQHSIESACHSTESDFHKNKILNRLLGLERFVV